MSASSSQSNQFTIPDLFAIARAFTDAVNPHWERAATESRAWVNGFRMFADKRAAFFLSGQSELLVSHAYPYAAYDEFRTVCDFVNLLFVMDEVSDRQNREDAQDMGDVYLRVMRDPTWDDGSKLAQMTREFRERFMTRVQPRSFARFLKLGEDYIHCVAEEAGLRVRGEVFDLHKYTLIRRENSAVRVCFGMIEYVLGIDLPDEVFADPVFQKIYFAGVDMVCWANDLYSYDMEQTKGLAGNNFLTVLMRTQGMTLQQASDYTGGHFQALMDTFLAGKAQLRSFGPAVDAEVKLWIECMQHWPVGNLHWSFETPRYYGAAREEVRRTRVVTLSPLDTDEED
ncbi:terpenoid synthase [Dentipellis sp. KUC8613]|nr:terpenoid synthase [Dentipellis sp. KUC8613]